MIVVLRVQDFSFQVSGMSIVGVQLDAGKMIGYLPVYDNLEDAKKEFPNGPFQEIEEIAE